jgi:hypothetical protein
MKTPEDSRPGNLMTAKDAAALLGMKLKTFRTWLYRYGHGLPGVVVRIGRRSIRIDRARLLRALRK